MAAELRVHTRKATNTDGPPAAVGNLGNVAANVSTAAVTANRNAPKLYISDGTQWLFVNPAALIEVFENSTATAGQTTVTLFNQPVRGVTLSLNGALLRSADDYNQAGKTITFTYPLQAGDSIVVEYWA